MPTTLKFNHPIARKEHVCTWCGGKIKVGEKYDRQTLMYDDYLYEWKNHKICLKLANALDMFKDCDDCGLDEQSFRDNIEQYLYDNHTDAEGNVLEEWDLPTTYEKVLKLADEFRL